MAVFLTHVRRLCMAGLSALMLFLLTAPSGTSAQETVRVRTGDHGSYTRLVFDFKSKVGYKLSQKAGFVELVFDTPARLSVGAVNRNPPVFVGGIRTSTSGSKTIALLSVPPGAKIKDFFVGSKLVLDVNEPPEWRDPPPLPAKVEVPDDKKTAAKPTETAKAPADQAGAAPAPPKQQAGSQKPENQKPAETVATAPSRGTAPGGAPIDLRPPSERATASAGAAKSAPAPSAPAQSSQTGPSVATASATGAAGDGGTVAAEGQARPGGAPAPGGSPASSPAPSSSPAQVAAEAAGENEVTLRFDWTEPVAAAVFERGGRLWIIFDKRTDVDVDGLLRAGGNALTSVEQIRIPQATVLRATRKPGINPSLRRDGLAWLLDFKEQKLEARTSLEVKVQPDSPLGARILIPMPEPGKVIPLTDPDAGVNFFVVPGIPLGHGVRAPYRYPQFSLARTAQGVLVEPVIDDLRVRSLRPGVEITSGAPTVELSVSPVSDELAATARIATGAPLLRILELDRWEVGDAGRLLDVRKTLERNVALAPQAQRTEARLDLARFYVANSYGAEALGVLRNALREDKKLAEDRQFWLLRAIGHYLSGRFDAAEKDLQFTELAGNDEAEFWRAIVQASKGDLPGAAPELRRSRAIPREYPKSLRLDLGTIVAEAAIEIGDARTAETLIESLLSEEPSERRLARINFAAGKLAEISGDFDGAVQLWDEVSEGPDRLARFRAAIARSELLKQLRRRTPEQQIEDYEKLRFAWRGDEREFRVLKRLGELYLGEKKYREGLQTLRQAATHFRDHPEAKQITRTLSTQFSDLFLNDQADVLPPVSAIAIYDEFKELTPAGVKGDLLIQKLADRLVGVDLLKPAAMLLERQIKFRLTGVDRARVGARLALIHLLNKQPDQAEQALTETAAANLPERLETQRRHLLVQALMNQNKDARALALLENDFSVEAGQLKTEIFWNNGQWADAVLAIQDLLEATGAEPGKRLNRRQARYVLNLATALTLSNNEVGLGRLRQQYGRQVAGSEFGRAFRLISNPPASGVITPESVDSQVKVAEGFQSFLTAYEQRLRRNPLSAIN